MDHIYISNNNDLYSSGTLSYGISDHNLVYLCRKKITEENNKKGPNFSCRAMNNYSYELLQEELGNISWEKLYNASKKFHKI